MHAFVFVIQGGQKQDLQDKKRRIKIGRKSFSLYFSGETFNFIYLFHFNFTVNIFGKMSLYISRDVSQKKNQ